MAQRFQVLLIVASVSIRVPPNSIIIKSKDLSKTAFAAAYEQVVHSLILASILEIPFSSELHKHYKAKGPILLKVQEVHPFSLQVKQVTGHYIHISLKPSSYVPSGQIHYTVILSPLQEVQFSLNRMQVAHLLLHYRQN